MDALCESLKWIEGLEIVAEENDRGMAAQAHGQVLQGAQAGVAILAWSAEVLLEDDQLELDVGVTGGEIFMAGRDQHFVIELAEDILANRNNVLGRQSQQGWLVARIEKVQIDRHGYLSRRVGGRGGPSSTALSIFFIRKLLMLLVVSPRCFLRLSMPRETGPRLEQ